jgi:putative FmdB family regulatory protein
MPIYEFACPGCGPFDVHRPAARSGEGAACPVCGAAAARVFAVPGGRADMAAGLRRGLEAEERSREAPQRVSGAELASRHRHAHAHGTSGGRPWQLSH